MAGGARSCTGNDGSDMISIESIDDVQRCNAPEHSPLISDSLIVACSVGRQFELHRFVPDLSLLVLHRPNCE